MTRLKHTVTMTIMILLICLVIGYTAWLCMQQVAGGAEEGRLSVLLSLRMVFLLVLLVIAALCAVLVMEYLYFKESTKQLEMQLNSDMLTGACSRRYGYDCLVEAFGEFQAGGASPVIMIFDLDHLKTINDSYGHVAGDQVLQGVVQAVSGSLGPGDLVIRWGGDEFVVLCRGVPQGEIAVLGRRLVEAVALAEFQAGEELIRTSISLGASVFSAQDTSITGALARADRALYQAKNSGRNQARLVLPESSD